jgi:hypothetical protein
MLVTKPMCVVVKLVAIWVATRKRHVCADILKPVSFKLRFGKIIWRNLISGSSLEKFKPNSLSLFDTDPLVCLPWPRLNRVIEGLPEFKALGRKNLYLRFLSTSYTVDSVESDSRTLTFTHVNTQAVGHLAKSLGGFGQLGTAVDVQNQLLHR